MKHLLSLLVCLMCWTSVFSSAKPEPVVVAYVTSWTQVVPDATVMTHINYAFGHVNEQFNGVRVDNIERLRSIVALKKSQPQLRVMLSIGGWGSGRFSEMSASEQNRLAFARDCRRLCDELGLDGIDIDWEYPTQSSAGISSSPQDTENFTLLMRDLRKSLGKKFLLTLASVGSAQYIDFRSCQQYLDFVNVMAYDMGSAPKHHAALFRSAHVGWLCAAECVEAHRKAGVPDAKIVLGMPFYGRGKSGQYMKYADRAKHTETECWDDQAKASYLSDANGELAFGFDSPRSIATKCAYIKKENLRGAMYWEYADDNASGDLRRAVWQGIMQNDRERSKVSQEAAKRLTAVLADNQKREDITPDSFFHDWRNLKAEMLAEKNPTAQAIYRAAMAHLLCQNVWRSQGFGRKTSSHPDSIQEWGRQEYTAHAAELYAQSLSDAEALHAVRLADTKPLAEGGKDDGVFGGDLLHVVWQSAQQDLTPQMRREHLVPDYADIIEVYRNHGLREATLQLRLDSIAEKDGMWREEPLLSMKEEYADLPACALVYLRLASFPGKTPQEQQALLEDALRLYPKCRQANEIRNRLAELRQPMLQAEFRRMFYPDRDYDVPFSAKNMLAGSLTVYRMPLDFAFSDDEKDGTQLEQVRRSGTLVETQPIDMTGVEALEARHDTLRWHTPSFGRYALVLDGTTREKLGKGYAPQVVLTRVSALTFMSVNMPDSTVRVMVTDAMSGEPQRDVRVSFYQKKNQDYALLRETTTDVRGICEAPFQNRNAIYIDLSLGEDKAHERQSVGWLWFNGDGDRLEHRLNVYTDRSIYRPGQIVYVGGIAYTQSHEQSPQAEPDLDLSLTLYDANGQELAKHALRTDEYGTLQDSIVLPESGLPGRYSIRIGEHRVSFRVEEYRRPTFEVKMDEAPAITLPADSITLTGCALTYSQWPVAGARVTGTYEWQQSWWYKRFASGDSHSIDTLYTDDEGRFCITVPIDLTKEQLRWGQTLQLSVDVMSAEGETRQGSLRVPLCSTPLRMSGNVPEQECKEALESWRFDLYSSNDKPVQGDILCTLTNEGKDVTFTLPAGCDTIPDVLRTLPSGKYDLVAKADIKGDTASFKSSFTIFSITDKRLQGKHDLLLFAPAHAMSAEKPARFMLGTTLPEAWIYVLMTGERGVVRDTLLHLSDEATLFEVPYEERFRHKLGISAMLIHDGSSKTSTAEFSLEQPDSKLRMRWDTFRNLLQPGQKEQWRLTLTRPDGTPASANVMIGMYDASLDALSPYNMRVPIYHSCNRNVLLYVRDFYSFAQSLYLGLDMPLRFLPSEGYDFGRWNEQFFQAGMPATRGGVTMRLRGAVANRLEEVAVYSEVAMAKGAAPQDALQGRIAGLDIVESADDLGAAEEEDASEDEAADDVMLRSNLSELAFFCPQLRTDSKGQTSIEFILPQSLTSWHLHGIAHTKDMLSAEWQETVVAKKELMAELTLPRFLRNGDEALLTASVRNASERQQRGEAILDVCDAETGKSLKKMKVTFDLAPGCEDIFQMSFKASIDHPVLVAQWSARTKDSSDGEMRYLPVLSDMQNVTETRTYLLRGDTILNMSLGDLFAGGNMKAAGRTLTVEHVSEPVYLAVQSLPSLSSPVRSDVLSVASAYYGGCVAHHVAHSYPALRNMFATTEGEGSTLEKNQQLADILLNETPWVADANRQRNSSQRLASLFDEMEQEGRRMTMLSALSARQHADGSFGWFPGMRGNVWMTTEVATLLVRLGAIKGGWTVPERQVVDGAMSFLTKEMRDGVESMRKAKNPALSLSQLRFLYIYIMYRENSPLTTSPDGDETARYLLSLLKKQADDFDREERALAAIVLQKAGEEKKARALMPRLHELLRHADGLYLAYPGGSFTSIDRKVETHVVLMEAVSTVEPMEKEFLGRMSEWLIRQKRTQEWEQPVQTADAVYALITSSRSLSSGEQEERGTWSGTVAYDNQSRKLGGAEGAPYVRERMELPTKGVGRSAKMLRIEQRGRSTSPSAAGADLLSWGAVYAQYQLPASEAESHREGMTIRREVEGQNANNPQLSTSNFQLSKIHVRYTITADRDYEYVCLRAPRPAAAEPASQLSGYHWQNGLGYYQALHDASTEYFMDSLPRGTYVIEEEWLIARQGSFLLPPARLTCLYAPEYQSQTAGERLHVK